MDRMEFFFKESYSECKKSFLESCDKLKQKYKYSKLYEIPFGKNELSIDCFLLQKYLNPSKKLILISSGVHGVEGYFGSAIQTILMEQYLKNNILLESDILFLHGVNPWGFQNNRRTNENNIDLNRNFFFKREKIHKKEKNRGYKKLASFFMPKFPFTFWGIEFLLFTMRFGGILIRFGVRKFTDALVNGQFQFKKGIYYGGKKPEPVVKKLKQFFINNISEYTKILFLDLHTGHGEKSKIVLIQNALPGTQEDQNISAIVSKLPLLRPDSSLSFYKTAGDFTDYLERIFPGHTGLFPLTVEMGTLGNLDLMGALQGTFLMVAENRIHHRGAWFESSKIKVNSKFVNYFYPNSVIWKRQAAKRTLAVIRTLIRRFESLKSD